MEGGVLKNKIFQATDNHPPSELGRTGEGQGSQKGGVYGSWEPKVLIPMSEPLQF